MLTKLEVENKLNQFKPRPYQLPLFKALQSGFKRVLAILPRRAGKDITALNYVIRQMYERPGVYFYIFPTYSQAKKVIWDSVDNSGKRILDYFPADLVEQKNASEMKIRFKNGSLFQLVGSDNFDSLVGTNPRGCVFSEYALQDPMGWQYIKPILAANGGWAFFISTPRGKNSFWELYQMGMQSPDWFVYKLTLDDTKHIPISEIEKERKYGEMSEDLIQQEYYCSFEMGIEGSYYNKYIDKMKLDGRIGQVPWESAFKVHTAWDIGVRDSTSIIFFQTIGQIVRIIDCYQNSKHGLEHYAEVVASKPYNYGTHIAPHDIRVREWGSGITRIEKARQLGIKFKLADDYSIPDGIEACRSLFSKLWINRDKCKELIKALENYRQEYDAKKRVYKPRPLHDQHSHFCFDGEMLVKTSKGDIKIKNVREGDSVLTPLGFRKVLKTHKNQTDKICEINNSIFCTPEHNIFMQNGLTRADELRYNDVLEPYGKLRNWLWKKIFGYYIEASDLKGFKKTILSLKTKNKSCLMDTFIDGTNQNIIWEPQVQQAHHTQAMGNLPRCKDIYGKRTMVLFLKDMWYIIKMATQRIIRLKTWSLLQKKSMEEGMLCPLIHGHNLMNAKNFCEVLMKKQKSGTKAKRGKNGILNMLKNHYQRVGELDTKKHATYVPKNISGSKRGKSTVPTNAKLNKGFWIGKTLKKGFVLFAIKSLNAINIILKRHVVKNVQVYHVATPREVYDLTIEDDNCYYINNYLVSNCDSFRYLAVSLPKTRDSMSAEQLDKNYQEAMYGEESNMPHIFRNNVTM